MLHQVPWVCGKMGKNQTGLHDDESVDVNVEAQKRYICVISFGENKHPLKMLSDDH